MLIHTLNQILFHTFLSTSYNGEFFQVLIVFVQLQSLPLLILKWKVDQITECFDIESHEITNILLE